jgi:hypothetical protein
MTDEERMEEESIEDLEAPATAQDGVAGGGMVCIDPTCAEADTHIPALCTPPTCRATKSGCGFDTSAIVVREA